MSSKQAQQILEEVVKALPAASSPSSPVVFSAKPGAEPFFTVLTNSSKGFATSAYHEAFPSTDPLTFNGIGGTVGFLPIIQVR
jgi:hypothetical protein